MKNKSKYVIIGILTLAYIIISLNFHKIKFALNIIDIYNTGNKYEKEIQEKEDINDIVENPLYFIIETEKPVENPKYNADIVDNQDKTIENNETNTNSLNQNKIEKESLSNIADKYNKKLESLQNEFLDKLNDLISSGYEEYKSGKVSTTKLASKYISEGSNLEQECDKKVYSIIDELEKELIANDYDTSLVAEVKNYYKSFKQKEKERLFNKVASRL